MNIVTRLATIAGIGIAMAICTGWSEEASARYEFGDLEINGEVFVLSEILWRDESGPENFGLAVAPGVFLGPTEFGTPSNNDKFDTVSALRTELSLEFVYRGIAHITPVLKLRAFYDAMYDINDKNDAISDHWQSNINGEESFHDDWDPLIREAYLDFNYGPTFVRAGRQIVTWGRSDGVTVLDIVTPRNFRNPLTFEQERFMIPQDMVNFKFDLSSLEWLPGGIQKELQIIWNFDYTPSRYPGFTPDEEGSHPWTLGVVDYANQVINVSEGLGFGPGFFRNEWDDGDAIDRSEVFVKWGARTGDGLGPFSDLTYSFHYAYLFNDLPFYKLQTRIDAGVPFNIAGPRAIGGGIDFERERYEMVGFSLDKALMFLPGIFQGTVFRGEVAYNMGDRFYEPDLETHEANSITSLLGLDQYLYIGPKSFMKTPWFVSFQWWRDEILRDPGPGEFTNLGSVACNSDPICGERGYIIGGANSAFNGLRDRTRNVLTLFMFNDFLPGKTLHVELFGLHELESRQRSTWVRAVVGYSFSSRLSGRVGINYITGEEDAFFGQFERNDSTFFELKFTF